MRILTFDCEHSYGAFRPWEKGFYLSCIGMVDNKGMKKLWWFDHADYDGFMHEKPDFNQNFKEIQHELDNCDLAVAHNLKHDTSILQWYRVIVPDKKSHCTMLVEYLLSGQNRYRNYNLNSVCEHYNLDSKEEAVRSYWDRGIDTYDIPSELLGPYCLKDCELTLAVALNQRELVHEEGMEKLVDLQNEYTHSLVDMETNGFAFDMDRAMEIYDESKAECLRIQEDIRKLVGQKELNIDSTSQLAAVCYGGELKIKWTETAFYKNGRQYQKHFEDVVDCKPIWKQKNMSTAKDIILSLPTRTKLQREMKRLLVEYGEVKTVAKTLLNKSGDKGLTTKVQEDGKVHPNLNQTVARTGRLTSSDPNGQNLPRDGTSPIKQTIIPTLDYIFQWDLSQIEWRGAAFISQDKNMIDEIVNGVDQHINACVYWMELPFINKKDPESKKDRDYAKVFNFRMIYGGVAFGFFMDVKMPNFPLPKWESIERQFYDHYYGLEAWQIRTINQSSIDGYFRLPTGRKFLYFKEKQQHGTMVYNENQMKNYPVQGLAGDIIYLATVIIRRAMKAAGVESKMILTVHDSVVFDAKKEEIPWLLELCTKVGQQLPQYIENYFGFHWNVPLAGECEFGPNYGDLEEIEWEEELTNG